MRLPVETGSLRSWDEAGEVSVDLLPLVGRLPGRPLAVACGFGALSAGFAFAAARWVADAVLCGVDPTPEPLSVARPSTFV
jgi:glycine/D-amino acid oxidase-like deaminating enzyme